MEKAQPFVKWVGGKRGLLSQLLPLIPHTFNNYYEPFVGGGALFFALRSSGRLDNKKITLFDSNAELINTYKVIQKTPQKLLKELKIFEKNHSHDFYYSVRDWDRHEDFSKREEIERAARFIYLNKTCFNGLYRVNRSGHYNVPLGRYKNPKIHDEALILSVYRALKQVNLILGDYTQVGRRAKEGDFVYFDPPYYPLTKTANFTAYSANAFLEKEQETLAALYKKLDQKGCLLMHSNSDMTFIRDLYRDYRIETVYVHRYVNSDPTKRGKISETVIKNFD